ncbi:MAG: STAS domain-containing protein [Chloroflexaceae bacterium]|nr:STAS domain-containing protein [Chloroflexaceae bacterium]
MTTEVQQFGVFIRESMSVGLDVLTDNVAQAGPNYDSMERFDLFEAVQRVCLVLAESMEHDQMSILTSYMTQLSYERARSGFLMHEMLAVISLIRNHFWVRLERFMADTTPWSSSAIRHFEDFFYEFIHAITSSFEDSLKKAQNELIEQSQRLEDQNRTIRELNTPILPVHEGVLVLPLVGALDSMRATQVMENLLQAITDYQSDMVIIDITGVPVVDTSVANYLLQASRAANLVGAQIILVGIGSRIAQTMVELGVDMSGITTLANLQEGLQFAFERLGYSIGVSH